jgi:RNA polymerase sigma-70 factor (ECF subfamily)
VPAGEFGRTLQAAQGGDEEAFAALWRHYHPGLLRYLKVKAAPMAEDLAADVWLRVLAALPAFKGDDQHFKAWLYTTARNRTTDWYRSGQRRLEYVENSHFVVMAAANNVELEADQRSATDHAIALIRQLPPKQAEAVMLRVVAGLDVPHVAKLMGRSAGSVRVLCHRGLRLLEQLVQESNEETRTTESQADIAPDPLPSTLESA